MIDLHIIPECYIDTKLIKAFVPPITRYNHQKGCSTVVKQMKEKFGDDFAVGIVDRDKVALGYAEEFDLISEVADQLQLFKHHNKNHYLIFICPAVERWIIFNADEVGINLNNYNLPHDFKELTKVTKTSKSENDDIHSNDFKHLFRDLKRQSTKGIDVLSFWIGYLKSNPYTADLQVIINQTDIIIDSK